MSLKVVCPAGHLLQVAPRLAGRTLPCPRCGLPVVVPPSDPSAPSAPSASTFASADIPFEPIVASSPSANVVESSGQVPSASSTPPTTVANLRAAKEQRAGAAVSLEAVEPSIAAPPAVGAPPPNRTDSGPSAPPPLDPPARLPPPLPPPPPRLGYECPADERSRIGVVLAALGAVAFVLIGPAAVEIADHLSATTSAGVGRWAYALLAMAVVQVAYAAWLWQAPDWSGLAAVSIVELLQAMLLAFVLGLLLAARPDHGWLQWMELSERAGGDLPRLWCLIAVGLIGGLAVWSGRLAVAWRRRASSSG